jgi:hypothetical protein
MRSASGLPSISVAGISYDVTARRDVLVHVRWVRIHPNRAMRPGANPSSVDAVPLRRLLAIIVSLAVALTLTGIGGASSAGAAGTRTAAPNATSGGGNKRLSAQSWAVYKRAAAKAKSVNTAALATWTKCRVLAAKGASSSRIKTCLGDSLSTVVTEGQKLLKVLHRFDSRVAGACASSLTKLEGYTKLYIASVKPLQTALAGGGVGGQTGFGAQLDNARVALARARATQPPFEAACRPK